MSITPNQTQLICSLDMEGTDVLKTFTLDYCTSASLDVSDLPTGRLLYFSARHGTVEMGFTAWSVPVGIYLSDLVRWIIRWTTAAQVAELREVVIGSDSSIYVYGYVKEAGISKVCIGKFDQYADTIWLRYISIPSTNVTDGGLVLDSNGKLHITVNIPSQGFIQCVLDPTTGNILLQKKYTDTAINLYSLCRDTTTNQYAVGVDTNYNSSTLRKYTNDLSVVWQKQIYASSLLQLFDVVQASDGGCFACGVLSASTGRIYAAICKVRAAGTMQWSKYINTADTVFYGMAADSVDNSYAVGYQIKNGLYYGLIVKFNTKGGLVWSRLIPPPAGATSNTFFTLVACTVDQNGDICYCGEIQDRPLLD